MTTTNGGDDDRPVFYKWQYLIVAATPLIAAATLIFTITRNTAPLTATTTVSAGPATTRGPVGPHDVVDPPTPTGPGPDDPDPDPAGSRLWHDLRPVANEPCHVPPSADGAAWHAAAAVPVGDRAVADAIVCNVMAGGTGSLDFELGQRYRELNVVVGFAADSPSTQHRVRFEVIGDDRVYLVEPRPTLAYGQSQQLRLDVSGTTRLRLRVVETSPAGSSSKASRPVFGDARVTPR